MGTIEDGDTGAGQVGAGQVGEKTGPRASGCLPRLAPQVPVLVRPDHAVHVGMFPESALIWPVPDVVNPAAVAALIEALREQPDPAEVAAARRSAGLSAAAFDALLSALADAGKTVPAPAPSSLQIRVNGSGPLAESLHGSLDAAGLTVIAGPATPEVFGDARPAGCNLLVLADQTLIDPAVRLALMRSRTPHLVVGIDDECGTIGPLVLPGLSSCLRCADLHRSEIDPQWPLVAAQLGRLRPPRCPELAGLTAVLAHHEILGIAAALTAPDHPAPQTLDHVLAVRISPAGTRLVPAPRHRRCTCRYPQENGRGIDERDHTGTGPAQRQTGLTPPRHGRSRGRRRR